MEILEEKEIKGTDEIIIEIPAVETWPITHLRFTCKKNKVKGYTKMNREQLVEAVKEIMQNFKN